VHESLEQSEEISIEDLRAAVGGEVIGPADVGYDGARKLYFTGFDRRPIAVVRVADSVDVTTVVRFAAANAIEVAVRSGGHSLAGHGGSDGGIVIDLSAMRSMEIDPVERTAWAETGVTAGEYTTAAGAHGLATGFGDAPTVGIGGITLAGGVGFLHRGYGMTIDSLLAAEVVTADGQVLTVDAGSHPELFWAIRGGGGNFGVATRFRFRLHEVDEVVGGVLILPATPAVVEDFLAEAAGAPDSLSSMVNVTKAPPMPFLPAAVHGKTILMAVMVNAGSAEEGERTFAPFRALATPLVDGIEPMRYKAVYEGHAEAPHPVAMAVETAFVDRVDRADAEAIIDAVQRSTASMSVTQFRVLGGAVARVPDDATAFPHRRRGLISTVVAAYERPEERSAHEAWAVDLADRLRRGDRSAYVGFLGRDDADRVQAAYSGANWKRLREIKARYDPSNLFRRNHNVPPV
jgi:FAD/FMN-containing dehydrogenase